MLCSPAYASSLYPCDLTDAEWAQLSPLPSAAARPAVLLVAAAAHQCAFYFSHPAWRYWADSAYRGDALATWCATEGARHVGIITCVPHVQGFVVRPWCWIVERTLGWMGRQRRLSKDCERKVQTRETLLQLAMIRLMVRRLARSPA